MTEELATLPEPHTSEALNAQAVAYETKEKARQALFESILNNALAPIFTAQAVTNAQLAATNEHLAKINGTVAEHTKDINTGKIWQARFDGAKSATSSLWLTITGLCSGIVVLLVSHFWK